MPSKEIGETAGAAPSVDRLLGELIAEVRAVKHNQANDSSKIDQVGRQTEPIRALIDQVKEIKEEQARHNFRIAVLETDKNRREGAVGLVEWFARHWPVTVILIALTAAWTFLSGKHP